MEQTKVLKKEQPLAHFNQGISGFSLIEKIQGNEIIVNEIKDQCFGYIYAADDPKIFEFYYVLEGKIIFTIDGVDHSLQSGDSISIQCLEKQILFQTLEYTKLLLITNGKVFQGLTIFYDKLQGLIDEIDSKDRYTRDHCRKVSKISTLIAKEMNVPQEHMERLMIASIFHDVGKIRIPSQILKKNGKLTNDEYEIVKKHAAYTYDILETMYDHEIAKIASYHHERLDGRGYPFGVSSEQIPLESRILAVADAFHAMTSKRIYSDPKVIQDSILELERCSGTQFDGDVVQALKKLVLEQGEAMFKD